MYVYRVLLHRHTTHTLTYTTIYKSYVYNHCARMYVYVYMLSLHIDGIDIVSSGEVEIATAQKPNVRIICIRAQIKKHCTSAENRNSGKQS